MTTDLSILKLITDASLVVQIVMLMLVLASLFSWSLIMAKSGKIATTQTNVTRFEDRFWSGVSLNALYEELAQKTNRRGLERIFYDGFHEYKRAIATEPSSRLSVTDSPAQPRNRSSKLALLVVCRHRSSGGSDSLAALDTRRTDSSSRPSSLVSRSLPRRLLRRGPRRTVSPAPASSDKTAS